MKNAAVVLKSMALVIFSLVLTLVSLGSATGIAQGTGQLVVYSGRSESLVGPILEQFAGATSINVQVKYGSTSELVAALLEEGSNSPADLFFAQDPGALGELEEMFSALPGDLTAVVPDWARSAENKWVGLSGRARTVVYNTTKYTEADLPDDIYDFIDSKWKGKIGWVPSNASFQTMVTAMRVLWGEDKTRDWLLGVLANEPVIYSGNAQVVEAVGAGEIEVGFVNHYYLYRFIAEEGEAFPARNYHPRSGGPGALVMVAGVGILETAKNKSEAERFVEFMLSVVAQAYFANQTYEYPLVAGVNTNPLLVPLEEINNPNIGPDELADLKGTQELLRDTGVIP